MASEKVLKAKCNIKNPNRKHTFVLLLLQTSSTGIDLMGEKKNPNLNVSSSAQPYLPGHVTTNGTESDAVHLKFPSTRKGFRSFFLHLLSTYFVLAGVPAVRESR